MQRTNYIDYAKAVSIMFIVFIHVGFSAIDNVILFAMPVFFAATGYTYSCGKRSFAESAGTRFRAVMLPFWYMMLFYTILEVIRAYLFGYGTVNIAFPSIANAIYGSGIIPSQSGIFGELKEVMSYKTQPATGVDLILPTNCHLWFLPAMFIGYIIFILLAKPTTKKPFLKPIAIVILISLSAVEIIVPGLYQLPYNLGRGMIGAAFMLVGFWIKHYGLMEHRSVTYYSLTTAASLAVYITALSLGSTGNHLIRSVYGPYGIWSVFVTFLGGVAGIWLMFGVCRLIDLLPMSGVKNALSYIGKNVMIVYLWHMTVKFLFDFLYIYFVKGFDTNLLDEYKMALLPQKSLVYMIFEAILVVAVCVLICKFTEKIKASRSSKSNIKRTKSA